MISGSKGLNPHELAHRWVNDLVTCPNMSIKVGFCSTPFFAFHEINTNQSFFHHIPLIYSYQRIAENCGKSTEEKISGQ